MGMMIGNGITTSTSMKLKKGVAKYLTEFGFIGDGVVAEVGSNGCFSLCGDWFNVYRAADAGDYDGAEDITPEFFDGLRKFIPKGRRLVIHRTHHGGCRHPQRAECIAIDQAYVQNWRMPC